jgi:hypothetical protein
MTTGKSRPAPVDSRAPASGIGQKRKAASVGSGLKSQRKRRLTYAEAPQAHDRLLGKGGLVISGQLFVSLRHSPRNGLW